jgi:hypothetical protein
VNENFETTEWDDGLPGSAGIGEPKKYKKPFENQNGVTQPVSENVLEIDLDSDFDDSIAQSGQDVLDSDLAADDSSIYSHLDAHGEGPESLGVDFNNDDVMNDIPDSDMNGEIAPLDFGGDDEFGTDGMGSEDELAPLYETIKRIVETKLDDFGKHPAYQKKVMTLPKNADGSEWGEDWNDESTKGEEPYGKKIGSSAPFDDVVSAITNAVVTALGKKKE